MPRVKKPIETVKPELTQPTDKSEVKSKSQMANSAPVLANSLAVPVEPTGLDASSSEKITNETELVSNLVKPIVESVPEIPESQAEQVIYKKVAAKPIKKIKVKAVKPINKNKSKPKGQHLISSKNIKLTSNLETKKDTVIGFIRLVATKENLKIALISWFWLIVLIVIFCSFLMNFAIWKEFHDEQSNKEKIGRETGSIYLTPQQQIKQDFALKEAAMAPSYNSDTSTVVDVSTTKATSNSAILSTDNFKTQRCAYNGQNYAPGDIVKTGQNWVRCTPTITFTQDKPTVPAYSAPEWVLVQ